MQSLPTEIKNIIIKNSLKNYPLFQWLCKKLEVPFQEFKHDRGLNSVAYSKDKSKIIIGYDKSIAKLWKVKTGQCLAIFEHTSPENLRDPVECVNFNEDNTLALTVAGGVVKIWSIHNGQCLRSIYGLSAISAIFGKSKDKVLINSYNSSAVICDIDSGKIIKEFRHEQIINSSVFNKKGDKLLTASRDCTAKLWDVRTGECLFSFEHIDSVKSAIFNSNETQILTSDITTVVIWDVMTGQRLKVFNYSDPTYIMTEVNDASFNKDETQVLMGCCYGNSISPLSGEAILWDINTGDCLHRFQHNAKGLWKTILSINISSNLSDSFLDKAKIDDHLQYHLGVYGLVSKFDKNFTQVATLLKCESTRLWDYSIISELENTLKNLTIEQSLFLICIYEIEILKRATKLGIIPNNQVLLKINQYPQLRKIYNTFSEPICKILDNYIQEDYENNCSIM